MSSAGTITARSLEGSEKAAAAPAPAAAAAAAVPSASAAAATAASDKSLCIAILDAGAQYSKVIDRRVRELRVESHIMPLDTPVDALLGYGGLIISGGPQSVYGADAPKYDPRLFTDYHGPILGICYGMQLMNFVNGGRIQKQGVREDGQFLIRVESYQPGQSSAAPRRSPLYESLPSELEVLLTHGDSLTELAPGFHCTATSASSGICASIEHESRPLFGVQYHPEVDLTPQGSLILANFIDRVCRIPRSFTLASRQHAAIEEIRATVGKDNKVLCLLSGGVDSSVCAALLKEAIGAERIVAIIDNGFMRKNESVQVVQALEAIGLKIHLINARERFYNGRTQINGKETERLCETVIPEVKRKIIGDTFMRVSEEELRGFGLDPDHVYLAQGTLRPDLIESASTLASVGGTATVIKTHHNDTELVRQLRQQGKIIEPLRDLHKDEVRLLGLELGLPGSLVWRQPFPGPGLAVRIICSDAPYETAEDAQIVQALSEYNTTYVRASLLACQTVGVQGDSRSYSSLVALSTTQDAFELNQRAERDGDALTVPGAAAAGGAGGVVSVRHPNWHTLFHMAKEIPKKVHGVNRVVYVFGAPLRFAHYKQVTRTHLTPDSITQLQQADDIVNQVLVQHGLIKSLSQVPVILFPINFKEEEEGKEVSSSSGAGVRSVCIRTFVTNDFMTGVPALPTLDAAHTVTSAAASPSPQPSPSPSPAVAPADAFSPALDPVAAPVAAQEHVPLASVRFPTIPLAALETMVQRILAEVPQIARVCYDLTCKPPATTEWE